MVGEALATQNARRLQEKMVLFWHDHFATQMSVVKNNRQMAYQNRTFRRDGLGSFKTLVHQVTRDAAMLDFLDGKQNTKNNRNENYGRELMELFVLGVFDLNGNENYTQTDVEQMARCCTGYQIDASTDLGFFNPARFDSSAKTLFQGKSFEATGNIGFEDASGTLLPPERNVIDILFAHRDSDGELDDGALPRQEALGVLRLPEPVEGADRRDRGAVHRRWLRHQGPAARDASCTTSSTPSRRRPAR